MSRVYNTNNYLDKNIYLIMASLKNILKIAKSIRIT